MRSVIVPNGKDILTSHIFSPKPSNKTEFKIRSRVMDIAAVTSGVGDSPLGGRLDFKFKLKALRNLPIVGQLIAALYVNPSILSNV
jgi:hypothetical protein